MQSSLTKKPGLNKSVLQLMAILAMLIDHLSVFAPIPSLYFIMKFIGRASIVIMCYFIAEGYHKTHNIGKYIIRMAVFAAISQIPYYFYMRLGRIPQDFMHLLYDIFIHRNVIFSLFVSLCLLTILKSNYKIIIKILATFAALCLAKESDWGYFSILWTVGFGMFYGSKNKQMIWLLAVVLLRIAYTAIGPISQIMQTQMLTYGSLYSWLTGFGGFLPLAVLPFYNGEKGNMPKWIWYVFYPLQFIVIVAIIAFVF